ncbi:MFS transporter [Dactylosporangium sp. CA-092794]|uniref:MFS transporter n=1 Tax=Dactylosporangium sp. CA-092794 TaxID=3239929 RepID=UPI003D945FA6
MGGFRRYHIPNQAVLGTALVFTASGALVGAWVSRIPAVVRDLDLSAGQLGRALFALGVGSLLSMPLTGHVCRRVGSRTWVGVTAVVSAVMLGLAGFAPGVWALGAALFGFGFAFGSWDVAMNVQGSAVDRVVGREWMPRYHACWSLGSILGAGAGSVAARAGLAPGPHLAVAAGVSLAAACAGLAGYLDERAVPLAPAGPDAADRRGRRRFVAGRGLLLIGLLTFCSTVAEGAAGDWLALYLDTGRGLSQASAALGYTVFAVAMTGGRFAGSTAVARLGRAGAVRLGGVLAVAGVAGTVLAPWTALTYAGALLWGLGICLVFPAAVSAAGETARPAEAIALVTSIGYGSILVGPPLIGAIADMTGLGPALLGLAGLGAAIALLAPVVRAPAGPGARLQDGSASIAR